MENNIEKEMLDNLKKEISCECDECNCKCCECTECDCECCECDECDCECCECDECNCECCECDECDCDNCYFYDDLENILNYCDNDFSDSIKKKGENYYFDGQVSKVIKNIDNDIFVSYVYGSMEEPYKVNIYADSFGVEYHCTCPCEYPCKHIYATLIAISAGEFEEVELLPEVRKNVYTVCEFLEKIPAEELKEYLLSNKELANVVCSFSDLEEHFESYMPRQSYEYYYSNLYNDLVFDNEYVLFEYINEIKKLISKNKYEEGFELIKSIIEAYNDSKKINGENELIDEIPQLSMYLRVINRKGNEKLKEEINNWKKTVEEDDYYENVYVEDVILGLNN